MSYDELVRRKRQERDTAYLEPHEMTRKELRFELESKIGSLERFEGIVRSMQVEIAEIRAELAKPARAIVIREGLGSPKKVKSKMKLLK